MNSKQSSFLRAKNFHICNFFSSIAQKACQESKNMNILFVCYPRVYFFNYFFLVFVESQLGRILTVELLNYITIGVVMAS